jgi:D-inositol-3-phosphate glycosyltransferase
MFIDLHPAALRPIALLGEHPLPLALELAACGHAVHLFVRRTAALQPALLQASHRLRIVRVPAGPPQHIAEHQLLPYADSFARFVSRFVQRDDVGCGLVHATGTMPGAAALALKQALALPYILAPQTVTPIDSRVLLEAAQVIDGAPHGFDPQELWPVPLRLARHRLGLLLGKFIVLHAGSIAPHSGIDTTIEALAHLRGQQAIDAMLLVAPDADSSQAQLERLHTLAMHLGVAEHVRINVRLDRADLRYYYSAANVIVSMPHHGPSDLAAVEAMACARPVIGAACEGGNTPVLDGITGYLASVHDASALAARLVALHADRMLARAMGDEGMRHAFQSHTWRRVAQRLMATYAAVTLPAPDETAALQESSQP